MRVVHMQREAAATAATAAFASTLLLLSCCPQGVRARNPNTTVLNEWPMIMVHDAATTYLREGHLLNRTVLDWTITQPPVGTAGELNCGARGFDWRPTLQAGGKVVMHHGSVTIDYPMEDAIDEIIDWCANNTQPEDLVVLGVTDCSGSGCAAAVQKLLASRSIKWVTDCTDLKGLTVAAARAKYELPGGGFMMAIFDCWNENYVPANACSGYGGTVAEHDKATARDSALTYTCYADSKTKVFPVKRMMDYLDKVGNTPPDATGKLSTAQALWEETTESICPQHSFAIAPNLTRNANNHQRPLVNDVASSKSTVCHLYCVSGTGIIIGTIHGSSLLLDESRSQLNKLVTSKVKANAWPHVSFVEINNVCDGGPQLWEALKGIP